MSMEIFEHIKILDHEGRRHIEMQVPFSFATYLRETRQTICGQHMVQTWLNAVHSNHHDSKREVLDISFVK
jgi:predicted class III extradiol MEMO1 family dioxygenase